ncbi:MAG TPA: hypothetical protein VJ867_05490 [Gemmatimonadaceae bacterium]|nr:hypothetical protein [Gemmatimonadaceae bacterium]
MPDTARSTTPATAFATDPRRAIPRQIWLTNRARNALQRPTFIGAISIATFITAIVSMVVVPRSHPAPVIRSAPRPDTLSVIASAAEARGTMVHADSLLAAARARLAALTPAAPVADSAATIDTVARDSLQARVTTLDRALQRAEQAPLPASYKAIADLPELRGDARVRALVDSLAEIEREREGFGAVGGVDPIFVALTTRANEIGRAIQSIAVTRQNALRSQLGETPTPVVPTPSAPAIDTLPFVAQRDSARLVLQQANDSLAARRVTSAALDREEAAARERASQVAPPLALLASAFVLSAAIGFAAAFFGELRRPRVGDAAELERLMGVRVLSTVEMWMPSLERGRRQADRAAPTYLDPGAEAYQLAYLGLSTEHPSLLTTSVTGDDPAVTAVVACNLAAVAADEARNTLLLDMDPASMVASALGARSSPGMHEIVNESVTWPDATTGARVGRDKTVDLVPAGNGASSADALRTRMAADNARLARYYDAIFAVLTPAQARAGLPSALASPEIVVCVRPGATALRALRELLDAIRAAGGRIRGVVLWNAEPPAIARNTHAGRTRREDTGERQPELAASQAR